VFQHLHIVFKNFPYAVKGAGAHLETSATKWNNCLQIKQYGSHGIASGIINSTQTSCTHIVICLLHVITFHVHKYRANKCYGFTLIL
jgi:hypothetical protein